MFYTEEALLPTVHQERSALDKRKKSLSLSWVDIPHLWRQEYFLKIKKTLKRGTNGCTPAKTYIIVKSQMNCHAFDMTMHGANPIYATEKLYKKEKGGSLNPVQKHSS